MKESTRDRALTAVLGGSLAAWLVAMGLLSPWWAHLFLVPALGAFGLICWEEW